MSRPSLRPLQPAKPPLMPPTAPSRREEAGWHRQLVRSDEPGRSPSAWLRRGSLSRLGSGGRGQSGDFVPGAEAVDHLAAVGIGTEPVTGLSGCWVSSVVSRVRAEGWFLRCLGQAVAGRPTTSFQVAKRVVISCRYWIAVSRWRRGRKCGDIPLNADKNRWAPPGSRKKTRCSFRCWASLIWYGHSGRGPRSACREV